MAFEDSIGDAEADGFRTFVMAKEVTGRAPEWYLKVDTASKMGI